MSKKQIEFLSSSFLNQVNIAGTDLDNDSLNSKQAIEALVTAYENSNILLKQLPNTIKYFGVTSSVFQVLGRYNKFNIVGRTLFRGIPIIHVKALDEKLSNNQIVRNMIIYTSFENHITNNNLNSIESFYQLENPGYVQHNLITIYI